MTSKQLGLLLLCLCAITLTVAWIIERRQIMAFRSELDAWGVTPPGSRNTIPEEQVGGYRVDYPITSSPSTDADFPGSAEAEASAE